MNYKKILLFLIVHCALCIVHSVYAQTLKTPYQYGFEAGDADSANWVLNAGDRGKFCNDQWMIGNVEHSEGYQSLYISCDNGVTSNYGDKPNVVVAIRTLELETGNYDISFDWKVWGEEQVSELYVCALPDNYRVNEEGLISNDTIGFFHKGFSRFIQSVTTNDGVYMALSGSTIWNNASFVMSIVGGRKVQLAFVWVNANQDSTLASPMGACIDNIQINSAMCPKPENLVSQSECGLLRVQWDGVAPEYECGYKRVGAKYWNNVYGVDGEVNQPFYEWVDVEEGAYDVRVRAIADNDTSAYVYLNTVVVWCPDNHCFDFVSLDNKEIVTCEAGAAIMYPMEDSTDYSFAVVPPIDYGSNSIFSRHTTYWVQGEFDPRTGNRLRTIPEDELASVRLGNWNSGAQAERITYDFEVVDDIVLLMKYAVVLENPGHGEYFDPYFGLEILKEDGTPISKNATCGEAFFSPQKDPDKWNYSGAFVWKDWTTIGIDLRECKGQKIKIQLTTQDCTPGAHGGYAYFTLDCIDATIKSDGCENITLEAPSGFRYSWYNKTNKDFVPTTNQSIVVAAGDTTTYYCDVNYLDNNNCTFTLSSSVVPHNPKADFIYLWEPANCENIVKFENTSKVVANINGVDSIVEGKRCEHYLWEFEFNGETTKTDLINPKFVVPREGGSLKVRLSAYLSDELCVDVMETIIDVPAIYENYVTLNHEMCFGDYIIFGGEYIMTSGTWIDTVPNIWGCDSITTLNVIVHSRPEDVVIYDTICSSEPYIIGNYRLDSTGVYELKFVTNDSLQCDSIVILHLLKVDPLDLSVNLENNFVCADGGTLSVTYELNANSNNPSFYSIIFDSLAHDAGFVDVLDANVNGEGNYVDILIPANCRPNHYSAELIFKDTIDICGGISFPIEFDVYYSSSILQTKFGNMITIFDSAYNGGYAFVEYQWYENDVKLEGETKSFYLLDEGEQFSADDCYYLEVKRRDDGVVMRTCEICPGGGTPVENVYSSGPYIVPTVLTAAQPMWVENLEKGEINIFTISGQLVDSYIIDSEKNRSISAPTESGVYLVQIVATSETFITKIIITK